MIDSVELTFGHAIGTTARRVQHPRRAEAVAEPVRLDFRDLIDRLGSDDGQITRKRYGEKEPVFGHWKFDDGVELLYREGRAQLRASLPKLLTGRNDIVIGEADVHEGLRRLVSRGSDLAQHPFILGEAVPTRLDYVYQWQVNSVAWLIEFLRAQMRLPKAAVETIVVPGATGGRTLYFAKGSKRVIRFYDKVAELAKHGFASEYEADTLLRFEIQERRRPRLRLVHERGYPAALVRHELCSIVDAIQLAETTRVERLLELRDSAWPHALAYALASIQLADHDELLPVIRRITSSSTFYRWRARATEWHVDIGDWKFDIPGNAFVESERGRSYNLEARRGAVRHGLALQAAA